jgi:hypothetical protein
MGRRCLAAGLWILLAACGGDSSASEASEEAAGEYTVLATVEFRTVAGDTLHALDASSQRVVHVFPPSEGGFIRGLIPALTQDRRVRGLAEDDPFELAVSGEGVPLLVDPLAKTRIDMAAFGPAAVDFFEMLLASVTESEVPAS